MAAVPIKKLLEIIMNLPNIWSRGQLFCYSGLDGVNTRKDSMCGQLLAEKIGAAFDLEKIELYLRYKQVRSVEHEIVASDIIKGKLNGKEYAMLFISQNTVLGVCDKDTAEPFCHADFFTAEKCQNGSIFKCDGLAYCFKKMEIGEKILFSLAKSDTAERAEAFAEKALKEDFYAISAEKISYFEAIPEIKTDNVGIRKAFSKSFSVMKSQIYSADGRFKQRWTTPNKLPHMRLWLWDSVFHSVGNVYVSEDLAYESIISVLDSQRADGFIPHMADVDIMSGVTQPPIIAWGLLRLYEKSGNLKYLHDNFEKLKSYLAWNTENRDSNKNYLYEWSVNIDNPHCRCDECGMDNSPRFDAVKQMDCIDFSCFMASEARAMAKIAAILEKDEDAAFYSRLYENIKKAVNEKLWDSADKRYYDREIESDRLKKVSAVSSFLPLFAGICDEKQAKELLLDLQNPETFGTELPIPSVSKQDATFGSDMWRGPVWVNYNFLVIRGLYDYGFTAFAKELEAKTVDVITEWYLRDGTFFEYYDSANVYCPAELSRKGDPIRPYTCSVKYECIRDYGWTAALFAAMVIELYGE